MNILNYLSLSFRSWLKTPVVFVRSILMLAVGIDASVAAYGFLHAALLQPLPVKNPERIMRVMISLVGIYAAFSYWVRRSSREIGLRMALGASPGLVVTLYVRRGILLVGGGVSLGLILAALTIPRLQDLLYQVDARDPLTFVAVPAVLFIAAVVACYLSARHAARVDPMEALRRE